MRIYSTKYSCIRRKTVARLSYDNCTTHVRASFAATLSELTMRKFRDTRSNVVLMSYDSLARVLTKHGNNCRLSAGKMKLSNILTNVVRHYHECIATVARVIINLSFLGILTNVSRLSYECKVKLSYICGNFARHSHECLATVVRVSRYYHATVMRYNCKIMPQFAKLTLKWLFNKTAT